MEKKVKKAVSTKAFETTHIEIKAERTFRQYRVVPYNQGFIVESEQGSGWRPCCGNGFWHHEPRVYRNLQLAEQAVKHFISLRPVIE